MRRPDAVREGPEARPNRERDFPGLSSPQRGTRDTHRCRSPGRCAAAGVPVAGEAGGRGGADERPGRATTRRARAGTTGRRGRQGCGSLPARSDPGPVSARGRRPAEFGPAARTSRYGAPEGAGRRRARPSAVDWVRGPRAVGGCCWARPDWTGSLLRLPHGLLRHGHRVAGVRDRARRQDSAHGERKWVQDWKVTTEAQGRSGPGPRCPEMAGAWLCPRKLHLSPKSFNFFIMITFVPFVGNSLPVQIVCRFGLQDENRRC